MQQPDKNEQITVQWAQSQPLIAAFISSLVPDFHDADDILQNVAVVTVRKYEQFDPNRSFVAWAIGIAKMLSEFDQSDNEDLQRIQKATWGRLGYIPK